MIFFLHMIPPGLLFPYLKKKDEEKLGTELPLAMVFV